MRIEGDLVTMLKISRTEHDSYNNENPERLEMTELAKGYLAQETFV